MCSFQNNSQKWLTDQVTFSVYLDIFPILQSLWRTVSSQKNLKGIDCSVFFSLSAFHIFFLFFVFALHKIPQNRKLLADLGVWYKLRRLGPKKKEKKTKPRRCRIDQLQDSYPAWSPSQGDFTDLSQRQTLCQFWYATCLWIRRSASSQRAFCHFKCIRSPAWHEPYTLH